MGQFSRLEKALAECEKAADHDRVVQQMLSDFDEQKLVWESQREQEAEQLRLAYEKLMNGWKQLEDEKRKWLEEQDSVKKKRR